mgnify:CR=1 FL=1
MQVRYNSFCNLFEIGRNNYELDFYHCLVDDLPVLSWYDYQVALRRWWRNNPDLFIPRFLVLNVTGACPRRCWYCYASDYRFASELITVDDVVDVVERFGLDKLFVLGGEPLLRQDFIFSLLEETDFVSKGIATSLPFVNDAVLHLLSLFDRVKISVDGMERLLDKQAVLSVKNAVKGDVIVKYTVAPGDVLFRDVYEWCREHDIKFELGWVMWNSMMPGVERSFLSDAEMELMFSQIGDDNVFRERNGLFDFLNPVWDGALQKDMLRWWYPCPLENAMIAMNSLGDLHCCDELNVSITSSRYLRMKFHDLASYYEVIDSWWALSLSCEACEFRWLCKGLCLFGFQQKNEQVCRFIRKYLEVTISDLENRYGIIPFVRYNRFWIFSLKSLLELS